MLTLSVLGFDFGTTKEELIAHCRQIGDVESVVFKGKGSALVTFSTDEQTRAAAVALNMTTIPGNSRYIETKIKADGADSSAVVKNNANSKPFSAFGGNSRSSLPLPSAPREKLRPTVSPIVAAKAERRGCTVYVRGFDGGTAEETILEHLSQCGDIVASTCKRGEAFVTFACRDGAHAAVKGLDRSTIPGNKRYIDVMMATDAQAEKLSQDKIGVMHGNGLKRDRPALELPPKHTSNVVKIFGFDNSVTKEELISHCEQCGDVQAVEMKSTKAFVTYVTAAEAEEAVRVLQGTSIDGHSRYLDVKLVKQPAGAPSLAPQVLASPQARSPKRLRVAAPTKRNQELSSSSGLAVPLWQVKLAETWRLFKQATPEAEANLDSFLDGLPPDAQLAFGITL